MRTSVLLMLVVVTASGPGAVWAAQKTVTTDVEAKALGEMVAAIPVGSRVKAHTNHGKEINGTLMSVTTDAVIIKKKTRLSEPAVTVPFVELARVELQTGEGMSIGKAIGIGLAAGAGAILTLFAFVAALDD